MRADRWSIQQRNCFLIGLGLVSLASLFLARAPLRNGQTAWFVALAAIVAGVCLTGAISIWNSKSAPSTFLIVVGVGLILRLVLVFETPKLSDDVYRYIWDGRVQAAGINPYRYIPADPHLAFLRDDAIYPQINRRDYAPTIYPPMAQIIFRAIHQVTGSTTGFKASLLFFEAITVACLAWLLAAFGLPRERVLIYAWNPLALWEFSGSGHIDAAMIALIALALMARQARRDILTGFLLGAAILTKFYPVILFPALYRRWDWKMPLAVVLTVMCGYAIYLSAGWQVLGFLGTYTDEEGMKSGRYFLLLLVRFLFGNAEIPAAVYIVSAFLVLAALAQRTVFRWSDDEHGFLFSAGVMAFTFTFLLSPQFAWYWSWTLPFLSFLSKEKLLLFFLFTTGALLRYLNWFDDARWCDPHLALGLLQFFPSLILLGITAQKRRAGRIARASSRTRSRPPSAAAQAHI